MNDKKSARYFWVILAGLFILVTVLASGGIPSCGGGFDGDEDGSGDLGSTQDPPSSEEGTSEADPSLDDSPYGVKFLDAENLKTEEGGGTAGFNVILKTKPEADVLVTLVTTDSTEGFINEEMKVTLSFTPDEWDKKQGIRIFPQDDEKNDGDQVYFIQVGSIVSQDPNYNGIAVEKIRVLNTDDELPEGKVVAIVIAGNCETDCNCCFTLEETSTSPGVAVEWGNKSGKSQDIRVNMGNGTTKLLSVEARSSTTMTFYEVGRTQAFVVGDPAAKVRIAVE